MCLTFFQPYTVAASAQIISLNITKGTITEVFKAIEDQSEYKFFYNDNQINLNKRVDVNIHEESIEQVLNNVFRGTDITYKIVKNHVVLTNKTMKDTELPSTNQNRKRLTGQVVGQDGEPLIGVNVVVKGTTIGSMTDMDGNYILENVPSNATVEFSYIGYLQQSINVGNKSNLNVTLAEDTQKLDEVVVVGYGSFKKRDLTGAVSQVKGDEISNLPLRSAADALQGKAAGVTITSSSGSPGSLGNVRIRGVGTINNNDPLYVVDGLPQGDIGWLNARDIESIEVLKDASAQAIYGARAANGVILVSTKRGASGESYRSNIEFDMNIGFQDVVKTYDMLDAEGFMEYKNRAYAASGKALIDDFATSEKREQILTFLGKNGGRSGTDWWKESTRKPKEAISQNYNLAFSGGMKKLRYRASFGYMDQQGILKGSDYERLSGRLNVDSEVTKWLNLSANVNVTYESRRNLDENNSYTATVFSTLAADPITPVYRNNLVDIPDFLQNRIMGGYEPTNPWSRYTGVIYSNKPNTVGQVDRSALNQWHGIATKSNISGEVKLLPFLTFKSSIALDLVRNQSDSFRPSYYLDGDEYSTYAGASRSVANKDYWVFDNYLTYNQKFDKHAVTAMVGTSAEKERYEEIYAYKEGQVNNNPNQQIINAGTMNPAASGYYATSTLNSYFGRVFYSFDNRYMITANIRWDGSSKFADGNRWGYFPSVSAGWNFSEESFMKNLEWLSQGKLRAAWGEIGNDFQYHINGNVSTYKNKVKSLGSGANIPGKGIHLGYFSYTMTEPGQPIGYFYGYKTDGVFQTQEEIDNYKNNGQMVMPNAKPGDLKFQDLNKDGKLDDEDRTMTGNPHPDFTFGLTLGAEWKGFDISAFFQGSVGNDILNILKYDIYSGTGWYNAPKDILTTYWNGPGSTNENFAIDADSRMNLEMSDWYVENGSYVRLKNLTIGYTLPSEWTKKITINNLRFFVAAQNLFTITGYSGLDPEIGEINNSPLYKGCDMGFYPQPRTFMFGLSLKL